MLSWCLFRSNSLFSFHSWDIAPALCLGKVTVKGPLPCILFCFFLLSIGFVLGVFLVCSCFLYLYIWYVISLGNLTGAALVDTVVSSTESLAIWELYVIP